MNTNLIKVWAGVIDTLGNPVSDRVPVMLEAEPLLEHDQLIIRFSGAELLVTKDPVGVAWLALFEDERRPLWIARFLLSDAKSGVTVRAGSWS